MSNENNTVAQERVLGRVLSSEHIKQVGGAGGTNTNTEATDPIGDSGVVTTVARDSGVWGESDFHPYN